MDIKLRVPGRISDFEMGHIKDWLEPWFRDKPCDCGGSGNCGSCGSGGDGAGCTQLTTTVPATMTPTTYDAFGIIDRFPSGTLVMVYRQGDRHDPVPGDVIVMRTSTDQGLTWSAATTIAASTGYALNNVAGGVTAGGRLVVFYSRYIGSAYADLGRIYSDDEGVSWSTYATISHGSETTFSWYGPLVTLGGGTLMQSWYGSHTGSFTSYVAFSSNNGVTWGGSVAALTNASTQFTEGTFAYIGGGNVVGLVRIDNGITFQQVKSVDNGATWASQGTTGFDSWTGNTGPGWLRTFTDSIGRMMVACYYVNRLDKQVRVTYALGSDLIASGTAAWSATVDLGGTTEDGSEVGYASAVQSCGLQAALGWYYDNGTAVGSGTTRLKFFKAGSSGGVTPALAADLALYQLRSEKAAASGYASLDSGTKVPVAQLGTGTPDGTKFLRDDRALSAVKDSDLSTSDVTTNNATTAKHGFLKKLSNVAANFLDGTGVWRALVEGDMSTSDITTNDVSTSKHGFAPKAPNDTAKFLRGDATWATVGGVTGVVASDAIWDAKGDLAAATGADAAVKVAVGSDGQVLTADAASTAGVKWATAGGGPKTYLNKPAGNITRAATTVGAFSTAWQIASVIVAAGQNVRLSMSAGINNSSANDYLIALFRDSTQIAARIYSNTNGAHVQPWSFDWIDESPGAGTYTYEVRCAAFTSGTVTVYQTNITTDTNGGSSVFIADVYTP